MAFISLRNWPFLLRLRSVSSTSIADCYLVALSSPLTSKLKRSWDSGVNEGLTLATCVEFSWQTLTLYWIKWGIVEFNRPVKCSKMIVKQGFVQRTGCPNLKRWIPVKRDSMKNLFPRKILRKLKHPNIRRQDIWIPTVYTDQMQNKTFLFIKNCKCQSKSNQ